ncbi:MAG: 16S rRNA (uracil(1498)-N(3))-methyltransferase [Candidatus Omnitrophica bacterium]|nr:16S rRNA (uracil(1498)-N(3))-methyltransferase [Candidatus Omnitrophota bacterium]
MPRFYFPAFELSDKQIVITDPREIHHSRDVLRLKIGSDVEVFNGRGEVVTGIIAAMDSLRMQVAVQQTRRETSGLPRLILACAIPKKSKFEWIIEKATELGVWEIIPLKTRRSLIELKGERALGKQQRYETVALNAAKQSKRPDIPRIRPVMDFKLAVDDLTRTGAVIIPSLAGETLPLLKVLNQLPRPQQLAFLIGPEGDFTLDEYGYAHKKCLPVSLGSTVLKVETAAICALSFAAQFYF